jgi:hypothetical protein
MKVDINNNDLKEIKFGLNVWPGFIRFRARTPEPSDILHDG